MLLLKVPPQEGGCVSIYVFEDPKLEKSRIFKYKKLTLYTDLKTKPHWTTLPCSVKPLKKLNMENYDNVVSCYPNFHKNEILFCKKYGTDIPLMDQMICKFYKLNTTKLEYKLASEIQDTKHIDNILRDLLGDEKLTRQEKKILFNGKF